MKKIVAIDFGLKRMGLAISDATQTIALPWKCVEGGFSPLLQALNSRKSEIESLLVGLPLMMNGSKGEMAQKVEQFARELELAIGLPVVLFDERLSSKQAESYLRETGRSRKQRQTKNDETAATILLQAYLIKRRGGQQTTAFPSR